MPLLLSVIHSLYLNGVGRAIENEQKQKQQEKLRGRDRERERKKEGEERKRNRLTCVFVFVLGFLTFFVVACQLCFRCAIPLYLRNSLVACFPLNLSVVVVCCFRTLTVRCLKSGERTQETRAHGTKQRETRIERQKLKLN